MIDKAVIDFPLPDSPSKTKVSPRSMVKEILLTISVFLVPVPVDTVRFLTCKIFSLINISYI